MATVGPAFLVAVELVAWLARRGMRARRLALGVLVALFAVALISQNGAAEFRVQRGVMPGPIDLREGFGHHDFFAAEGPHVLAGRFLWMNLLSLAVGTLLVRRLRASLELHGGLFTRAGGLALAAAMSVALVHTSRDAAAFAENMHNRDALSSPSAALVRGFTERGGHDGSPTSARRLLAERAVNLDEIAEGARSLGLPPEAAVRLEHAAAGECSPHPLRRPLDPGLEPSVPAIVGATRALSRALFEGRTAPPIVFHVSLESMRADDIHALDPAAPAELAPFLSDVYSANPSALAFAHAHQSGVRTSHALGAVMCGIGALPFNLSMSRDLGPMPLRCMPDVLADAGFRTGAFYGHELVFDDMATFLRLHEMSLYERASFPNGAPRGVWGAVSDAAVYSAALEEAAKGGEGARYEFILTLSHHAPYTAPEDLAAPLRVEIDELCRTRSITGENCDRLKTLRYADAALRAFLERVESSKDGARTIVVVSGDHAVHQWVPWRDGPEGITQIPLFVWVPEAMRRTASDPAELAVAWSRLREIARSQPVSNADVPALVLALLASSGPLRALSSDARWHTIGGQATSPYYRSVTGRGVIHGIDAHAGIFDVSETGIVRPSGIEMDALHGPDDVAHAAPHNAPGVAFLGSLVRNHASRCPR